MERDIVSYRFSKVTIPFRFRSDRVLMNLHSGQKSEGKGLQLWKGVFFFKESKRDDYKGPLFEYPPLYFLHNVTVNYEHCINWEVTTCPRWLISYINTVYFSISLFDQIVRIKPFDF